MDRGRELSVDELVVALIPDQRVARADDPVRGRGLARGVVDRGEGALDRRRDPCRGVDRQVAAEVGGDGLAADVEVEERGGGVVASAQRSPARDVVDRARGVVEERLAGDRIAALGVDVDPPLAAGGAGLDDHGDDQIGAEDPLVADPRQDHRGADLCGLALAGVVGLGHPRLGSGGGLVGAEGRVMVRERGARDRLRGDRGDVIAADAEGELTADDPVAAVALAVADGAKLSVEAVADHREVSVCAAGRQEIEVGRRERVGEGRSPGGIRRDPLQLMRLGDHVGGDPGGGVPACEGRSDPRLEATERAQGCRGRHALGEGAGAPRRAPVGDLKGRVGGPRR